MRGCPIGGWGAKKNPSLGGAKDYNRKKERLFVDCGNH